MSKLYDSMAQIEKENSQLKEKVTISLFFLYHTVSLDNIILLF